MELRSCNHLHFVKAIKGGVVTKALNVLQGKPGLKFKNIQDIYEATDHKVCDPMPTMRPKLETDDVSIGCYRGDPKNCQGLKREKAVQGETRVRKTNCTAGACQEESDSDDLNFTTLKNIKEICKTKKRRCQEFATSSGETPETRSFIKQENLTSEFEWSDCDAMQPLSVLKCRILKDKRKKRNLRRNKSSSSYQRTLSTVEYKNIQGDQVLFSPVDIKVEVPEPTYSDCEGETEVALCPISACDELVYSSGMICDDEAEMAGGCDWETELLLLSNEKNETAEDYNLNPRMVTLFDDDPQYYVNEDCYFGDEVLLLTYSDGQYMVEVAEEPSSAFNEAGTTIQLMTNGHPETINGSDLDVKMLNTSDEEPEMAKDDAIDEEKLNLVVNEQEISNDNGFQATSINIEPHFLVINNESYDHLEHANLEPVLDIRASANESVLMDDTELTLHCHSNSIVEPCPMDDSPEMVSPNRVCVQIIPQSPKRSRTSSNDMEKHSDIPLSSLSVDGQEDSIQLNTNVAGSFVHDNISSEIPNQWSSPDDCLMSSVAANSPGVEKRSPSSIYGDEIRDSLTMDYTGNDEPLTPKVSQGYHLSKMQHRPERLFSTRKTISPTSQKRLQKAMESAELDDEQYYKYTRKLCYSNQTDNKFGSERRNQIKRTEVANSPKQVVTKSISDKNGIPHKGILRIPHSSRAIPRLSTNCTSVQSCSESAIAFSQQQMRDIETIATKLMRELKSMKHIIEATSHSEVFTFAPVNDNADQVRIAIHNATRIEEGARRLLSMMARDCDRFCKIMKLTGKGPAVPGNGVSKEKRKIIFADEAGGKLCDIKTFVNEIASVESGCQRIVDK